MFAQGPESANGTEIRRRVLSKLENEPYLTLQKLAEDCQWVSEKTQKNIAESGVAYEMKIKHRTQSYSPVKKKR